MTILQNNLAVTPVDSPGENPRSAPTYVCARLLAANTHEEITVPAKAAYVRLAATDNIYYIFGANAAVPGDIDDGSACELLKTQGDAEYLIIPPGATSLSVISAGTPIVTASFYTA